MNNIRPDVLHQMRNQFEIRLELLLWRLKCHSWNGGNWMGSRDVRTGIRFRLVACSSAVSWFYRSWRSWIFQCHKKVTRKIMIIILSRWSLWVIKYGSFHDDDLEVNWNEVHHIWASIWPNQIFQFFSIAANLGKTEIFVQSPSRSKGRELLIDKKLSRTIHKVAVQWAIEFLMPSSGRVME